MSIETGQCGAHGAEAKDLHRPFAAGEHRNLALLADPTRLGLLHRPFAAGEHRNGSGAV
ncbi:hypothetical protein SAMN05421505_1101, partial [Sinosporangium album]